MSPPVQPACRWDEPAPLQRLPSGQVRVAVCGAHMQGLPLNPQLGTRGGRLVAAVKSAPEYRFYALAGGPPFRPGMVRVNEGGAAIDMEIWELPAREFGSFVAGIPAPLGIGAGAPGGRQPGERLHLRKCRLDCSRGGCGLFD
jgi:hypothetical protein